MEKFSFKQYLKSKEQLREAAEQTAPKRTAEYKINSYCKIAVGESKDEKQSIPLRPKHKLFVDWLYEDSENPTPVSIRIEGPSEISTDQTFSAFWKSERLAKWLDRNSNEQQ